MDCYLMYPDRTWIVISCISCIPTVHGLLSHVSRPYMDCYLMYPDRTCIVISCIPTVHGLYLMYLMYPDRTWIVISCIPTVHGLLSHVSRPYMYCNLMYPDRTWIGYLMYPDRTWIVISCIPTVHGLYLMYPDRTWIVISCIPTVHSNLMYPDRTYWSHVLYYLMYPDRTWIVISCIPTVHRLLSNVSQPYMDCYLIYPDRTWISSSSPSTIMLTRFYVMHIWIRILEALTNITHAVQNPVVLTIQRLKLNVSNKHILMVDTGLELATWLDKIHHSFTNKHYKLRL